MHVHLSYCNPTLKMAFSQAMVDNFKEGFSCFDVKGHGIKLGANHEDKSSLDEKFYALFSIMLPHTFFPPSCGNIYLARSTEHSRTMAWFTFIGTPFFFFFFFFFFFSLFHPSTYLKLSGVVTTENLGRVMNAFGLDPSQDELKNMITEVDGSGGLKIS